ncbi:MAG: hypothetical protein ACI9IL_001021 [Rickettsiales bacterium]|jgi:hypothetical protein
MQQLGKLTWVRNLLLNLCLISEYNLAKFYDNF